MGRPLTLQPERHHQDLDRARWRHPLGRSIVDDGAYVPFTRAFAELYSLITLVANGGCI